MLTESTFAETVILHKTRRLTGVSKTVSSRQLGADMSHHAVVLDGVEPSSVIAVAANSYLVLQGLTRYLKASRFHAVAVMSSLSELASSISEIHPYAVIIEISSQSMEGFETIAAIHRINPAIKILVLADYTMPSLIKMIFRSGAHGYLLSMPTQSTMVQALDALSKGENVLDKQLDYIRPALNNVMTAMCVIV